MNKNQERELYVRLQDLAQRKTVFDSKGAKLEDCVDNNIHLAYNYGTCDGEILLARALLANFETSNSSNKISN